MSALQNRSSGEPSGADRPREVLADAQLAACVEQARADPGPAWQDTDPVEIRRGQRERAALRPPGPEMREVRDRTAAGVPSRLYTPNGFGEQKATVVFLHGGGFVTGGLESHDRACRRLAHTTGARVLAVDYRLAPEHPWPAAVDDAVAAVRWAAAELPGPLVLMGDSAGGCLAALTCLRLRDESGPRPAAQVLMYPNTDLTLAQPSMREFGKGWFLDAASLAWCVEAWVPDPALRADPLVSPLFAPDLSGLPAAIVVTCAYDVLRDEGEAYARRLAEAGTPVRHRREPGMIHGFLTLDTVSPAAAAAGDRVFADLRGLLGAGEDGAGEFCG